MSRFCPFVLSTLCLGLAFAVSASAQVYKLHNADVTVGGTGPFTTILTTNGPATQDTTDSAGFLFTLRDHPVAWAGVEFNYGYDRFSEVYRNQISPVTAVTAHVQTNVHEATAAYLFHPHLLHLQPFLAIGGGGLDFLSVQGPNQWRTAGLVELGFDIPTSNPHFGFRVQGRSLIYRAPNYYNSTISSRSWVVTDEPSLGAYIRF